MKYLFIFMFCSFALLSFTPTKPVDLNSSTSKASFCEEIKSLISAIDADGFAKLKGQSKGADTWASTIQLKDMLSTTIEANDEGDTYLKVEYKKAVGSWEEQMTQKKDLVKILEECLDQKFFPGSEGSFYSEGKRRVQVDSYKTIYFTIW